VMMRYSVDMVCLEKPHLAGVGCHLHGRLGEACERSGAR